MDDDAPETEPADDCVPLDAYLEMTARVLGRIQAIESILVALLAERPDLAGLARRVDAILLHNEASRIDAQSTDEETIKIHEWARHATDALFANARTARKLK